ncbi:MAG TPA: nitrile hydratase subunit beta [Stellaceae bacterium]|jgi:nitrile hydratase
MNGPHDLGGSHGLGPILREENEPPFHEEWERRAFALTLALGFHGRWNIDRSRHARENRHPLDYLGSSYYELWFKGVEQLAVETGLVAPEEIAAGRALHPGPADALPPHPPEAVAAILRRGSPANLPDDVPARFRPGDAVIVKEMTTPGHTRAPRYCRNKRGVVARGHGVFILPDTNAHGLGKSPQHLYSVRFDGRTLWGEAGSERDCVHLDLWDDYLDPAAR